MQGPFMPATYRLISLIAATMLLASCGLGGNGAPKESTDVAPVPNEKSLIAVPISANSAALQSALDRALPRTLWTINQKEDECVEPQRVRVFGQSVRVTPAISCTIIGEVTRGAIRLRGQGDEIIADVPINARISATDVGGVLKGQTATGSAMVQARIKIDISEDWQTSGSARLSYDWTTPPGIDFLGQRITFADQADERLGPIMKDVEREVAAEIAKLDLKSQAEKIWQETFTAIELNADDPPVWLRLTPQRIFFGGYSFNGQQTRLNFALEAITESFVSERPADPAPTALPNLVKQSVNPHLDVNIPVLAQYKQLTPVILRALIRRSARPIEIPGIGAVDTEFEKVTAFGAEGGKIAVGITLKATPQSGSSGTTSGQIWITATPVNQAGSAEVSFTDLNVTGRTSGVGGDLLLRLGNSPGFAHLIASALTQNFTKDLTSLQEKIKDAVNLHREGDFVVRANVDAFEIGSVRAYGNGIYLPVRLKGNATVDFRPGG